MEGGGEESGGGGVEAEGWRPSSLARTGSKSTNQLWNSARAIASSVAFIRRFNSILSSSAAKHRRDGFLLGERWERNWKLSNLVQIRSSAEPSSNAPMTSFAAAGDSETQLSRR